MRKKLAVAFFAAFLAAVSLTACSGSKDAQTTAIVTNMDSSPEYLVKFYCKRGLLENFIKESKSGLIFLW